MVPDICFLDRDGTLIRKPPEGRYVGDPAEVELLPGVGAAVRDLNRAGAAVHVVTNQRGVALGRMSSEDVDRVNTRVAELLAADGGEVDGWWVCPHQQGTCTCRKPLPGLLLAALATVPSARPGRCVVIGDAESDVAAGRAAQVPGILLAAAGHGPAAARSVCPDLASAVALVLGPGWSLGTRPDPPGSG